MEEVMREKSVRRQKKKTASCGMFGKKAKIFYALMLAFPVLQFGFFYVGVNFNSIILAFQKYDFSTGVLQITGAGFENFARFFKWMGEGSAFLDLLKNTFVIYGINFVTGIALGLTFSFYIYKKKFWSKFFRVILFLPSILSAIVLSSLWNKFLNDGIINLIRELFDKPSLTDLWYSPEKKFAMVAAFTVFMSFGSSVLLFTGTMDQIDESVSEYAQIDGCTPLREFFSVTLPMIFPTVRTFIILGIAGIFINQAYMLNFYAMGDPGDAAAPYSVFGYFLFRDLYDPGGSVTTYPYMAACGLVLTCISAPLTFGVKWLLEKFGPSEE